MHRVENINNLSFKITQDLIHRKSKLNELDMKILVLLPLFLLTGLLAYTQDKPPVANNDYTSALAGIEITYNVLANDACEDGDTIVIFHVDVQHGEVTIQDSNLIYRSSVYIDKTDTVSYVLKDINNGLYSEPGYLIINVTNNAYGWLDINNVQARFNAWGGHFWDYYGSGQHFYVPGDSKKGTLFNNGLWIGGLDENQGLHTAAERYRQVGTDFFMGPVSDTYDDNYKIKWNRVWKITRQEVEYHKANWWKTGYTPSSAILDWPAHGDTSLGQPFFIAPFYDYDNNLQYNPQQGDFPVIRGDQTLFFVFNDLSEAHTESKSRPLGIQVNAMAYAFDCPADSALDHAVFMHYQIINMSDTNYHDVYLGLFTDFDIGNPWDDYMVTDVDNNSMYGYNGDNYDFGTYTDPQRCYGHYPPAQSITLLGGPWMEPDGEDNPATDFMGNPLCDFSVTGTNFADGIIDNERLGITGSMNPGLFNPYIPPQNAEDYYNMLRSIFPDDKPQIYGGNGYPHSDTVSPPSRFIYTDNSDTLNWGIGCIEPPFPYNQPGVSWNETTEGNAPNDRRCILSSGPFLLNSHSSQELDVAFIFARDYQDSSYLASKELLKERVKLIHTYFQNDSTPCNGGSFSFVTGMASERAALKVYPNPAKDIINIETDSDYEGYMVRIIDVYGKCHMDGPLKQKNISIRNLSNGLYILQVYSTDYFSSYKFVKHQ